MQANTAGRLMRHATLYRQLWLLACLVLFSSCAHFGARNTSQEHDPIAEELFEKATRAQSLGRFKEAQQHYEIFLQNHARHARVEEAKGRLGQVYYQQQEYRRAIAIFEETSWHNPHNAQLATYWKGFAYFRLDEADQALQAWLPILHETSAELDQENLARALLSAVQLAKDPALALHSLDRWSYAQVDVEQKRATLEIATSLLQSIRDPSAIEMIANGLHADGEIWRLVMLEELTRAIADNRREAATNHADRLRASAHSADPKVVRALQDLDAWLSFYGMAIGVMVPVSGRGKAVGQSLLQGVELGGSGVDVVIRDAAVAEEKLLKALRELATDTRIVAVVGPAERLKGDALGRLAQKLDMPFISFAPNQTEYNTTFRILHTAQEQVRELVKRAVEAGATQLGIFHPSHGYGITIKKYFIDALDKMGLRPCAIASYSPTSEDWAHKAEALQSAGCQSVILADRPRKSASVAAALISADVGAGFAHPLLLPAPSYSNETLKLGGRYLEGALISLHARPNSSTASVATFSQDFRERYRRSPDFLAANAYDIGQIISELIDRGASSRKDILKGLEGAFATKAVGCARGFDQAGAPLAKACIATVRNAKLELVE